MVGASVVGDDWRMLLMSMLMMLLIYVGYHCISDRESDSQDMMHNLCLKRLLKSRTGFSEAKPKSSLLHNPGPMDYCQAVLTSESDAPPFLRLAP